MNMKVLIVEDDPSIANLQKDYLEINDIEVVIANSGSEGLDIALNNEFDLIILDIMLPGIDGFEICRTIRESIKTPIMMVSARKDDIDKIRGLGLGADDYMIKPFSPNELVARVKAHINRFRSISSSEENEIIELEELLIDKTAHRVFVNDEEISFTHKEFKLLSYLAERPNRVWSKEELFERIWDFDALDTDVSTVVVHVKRIREKLKKANMTEIPIETIWGSGYRFNRN